MIEVENKIKWNGINEKREENTFKIVDTLNTIYI